MMPVVVETVSFTSFTRFLFSSILPPPPLFWIFLRRLRVLLKPRCSLWKNTFQNLPKSSKESERYYSSLGKVIPFTRGMLQWQTPLRQTWIPLSFINTNEAVFFREVEVIVIVKSPKLSGGGGGGGGVGVCCCCRSWRVYELSCNEQLYSSDVAIVRIYNPGRNYSIQRLQRRADGSRRASGMQASIFGVRLEGECAVGLLTQKDHFEDLTPITNTEILEGETPKLF